MKLRSWRDDEGSSAGMWLVEDLPGAALACVTDKEWELLIIAPNGHMERVSRPGSAYWGRMGPRPYEVWGEDYSDHRLRELLQNNPPLTRLYTSRAELAEAIDAAGTEKIRSVLSQVI